MVVALVMSVSLIPIMTLSQSQEANAFFLEYHAMAQGRARSLADWAIVAGPRIQAVQAILERMSVDLCALAPGDASRRSDSLTLELLSGGTGVAFCRYVADPAGAPASPIDGSGGLQPVPVQRVSYVFDPATGLVTRRVGTTREVIRAARYQSVRFELGSRHAGDDLIRVPGDEDLLRVRVEWVREELLAVPRPRRGEVLHSVFTLALKGQALVRRHPSRLPGPVAGGDHGLRRDRQPVEDDPPVGRRDRIARVDVEAVDRGHRDRALGLALHERPLRPAALIGRHRSQSLARTR
jgi:hypothetical protein